jgi:predicted SAM-dependent methyltransferase
MAILPALRKVGERLLDRVRRHRQKALLGKQLKMRPCRLVVGAAGISESGWIPTELDLLDLLKPEQWAAYMPADHLDAILAEHVWEHLAPADATIAARTCYRFLRPSGYLRVAVPDGLHPDRDYIDWVKPGGNGPGSDDHKVLYNYRSLKKLFEEQAGFNVKLLEYFDEQGQFHCEDWDPADGKIVRSQRFDERNAGGSLKYTSLILDAVKG